MPINTNTLRNLCGEVVRARTQEEEHAALRKLSALINDDLDKTLWPDDGVSLIAAERQRQIEVEGYDPAGDDGYDRGQLPLAACSYSMFAASSPDMRDRIRAAVAEHGPPAMWPESWDPAFWKPGTDNSNRSRLREAVKAGALLAAEIDRLLRAEAARGQG